ncbi:hypothetical protein [unidentified bacterial endosymbiont]|uniref:hypothetical protein n=1 Tax=unidentified bacterial endosymbiont TaxID=2355 RepID=UPI00209F981E|nr:hypothetical protein [unidentified bacterial endosymbiont]
MKSPDADPVQLAAAVSNVVHQHKSQKHIVVYSTNAVYSDAFKAHQDMRRMVAREVTREILVTDLLNHQCIAATAERGVHGFEIERDVVTENFKLGEGKTKAKMVMNYTFPACVLSVPENKLILFGVNTLAAYQQACTDGAYAVMVDSPAFFYKNLSLDHDDCIVTLIG